MMKKTVFSYFFMAVNVLTIFISYKMIKSAKTTILKREKSIDKLKGYYNILNYWMDLKQSGDNICKYFHLNNYKRIAIYGMGELGFHLMDELKNSDIEVVYGIDDGLNSPRVKTEIKHNGDELEDVDMIVVTPVFAFDKIKNNLEKRVSCPIISLEEVIYSN